VLRIFGTEFANVPEIRHADVAMTNMVICMVTLADRDIKQICNSREWTAVRIVRSIPAIAFVSILFAWYFV
jgi:hypothetical protein